MVVRSGFDDFEATQLAVRERESSRLFRLFPTVRLDDANFNFAVARQFSSSSNSRAIRVLRTVPY